MDIAQSLRKSNIAEYILYIWQLEDMFRALQFSPQAIYMKFVAPRTSLSPEEQQSILQWYEELCELLQSEDKREKGHLAHTIHLISDLNNLHLQLLELPVGARYRTVWEGTKEALPDLRSAFAQQSEGVSDIELCFKTLYAAMLYRIKGQEGRGVVEDTLAYISPLIAELAKIYGEVERGEIDLFRNE